MADLQYQFGTVSAVAKPRGVLNRLADPRVLAVLAAYVAAILAGRWAIVHWAPDVMTIRLFGRALALGHLHARLFDRALEALVILPAVLFVEFLWVGWSRCSARDLMFRRTASMWSDVACFAVSLTPLITVAMTVLSLGVVLISAASVKAWLTGATGLSLSLAGLPVLAQTGILFVVYSFFDYWSHRADHLEALWPLHRYHHAAESFTVLTAARTHPAVFTALIASVGPGVLVSASPDALVQVNLFVIALRLLIHSRIESDFGWAGRWLVQSPTHHRRHHSFEMSDRALHLGLIPLWDRLFGTWSERRPTDDRIGVDAPYRHGAWIAADMWRDYMDFWRGLGRLSRAAAGRFRQRLAIGQPGL